MVQSLSLTPIQESQNGNMGLILDALMKKKAEEAKNKQDLFNLERLQQVGSFFDRDKEQTEEKKSIGSNLGSTVSGAATGAKFGSIFGPVGTGVGAVIGGIKGWFS